MSRRAASRWVALALGALVLLAGLSAALLTVHAVILAGLPYNEEGNHFDGLVVYHEGSAFVYAALAVLCWRGQARTAASSDHLRGSETCRLGPASTPPRHAPGQHGLHHRRDQPGHAQGLVKTGNALAQQ